VRQLTNLSRFLHFSLLILFKETAKLTIVVTLSHLHRHYVLKRGFECQQVLHEDLLITHELVHLLQMNLHIPITQVFVNSEARSVDGQPVISFLFALHL